MSTFATPAICKLHLLANPIVGGQDFGVVFLGDSKTTDTATASTIRDGVRKSWRVNHVAVGTRAIAGPPAHASTTSNRASETSGGGTGEQSYTGTTPRGTWVNGGVYAINDVVFYGGVHYRCYLGHTAGASTEPGVGGSYTNNWSIVAGFLGSGPPPYGINGANTQRGSMLLSGRGNACANIAMNWRFNSNQGGGVSLHVSDINAPTEYANGDPFGGLAVKARLLLWRDNAADLPMMDGFRLNPRRNSVNLGVGSLQTCVGTPGWAVYEADCGSGAGVPGIAIDFDGSITDTGKVMCLGGVNFYRHTANIRNPGFYSCDIAVGGASSTDVLAMIGGGSDPGRTNPTYVAQYLQFHHSPQGWVVDACQNMTSAASSAISAGDYSIFKAEFAAIVGAINSVHTLQGLPGLPVICLVNSYASGYPAATMLLRAKALYELALENPNVCFVDLYQLMPSETGTGFWTSDDTHPSDLGSAYWMGVFWGALCAAATIPASLANQAIPVTRTRLAFPQTRSATITVTGTSPVKVYMPNGDTPVIPPGLSVVVQVSTSLNYIDLQSVGAASAVSITSSRSDTF